MKLEIPERLQTVLGIILSAIAVTLLIRYSSIGRRTAVAPQTPGTVSDWHRIAAEGWRTGSETPDLTLTVFSDYQCPYCRRLWASIDTVLRSDSLKVAVVYRHLFNPSSHHLARHAAIAAECAGLQGKFWQYHALLFERQQYLSDTSWVHLAQQAAIEDLSTFGACLSSATPAERVSQDLRVAADVGAAVTPTFLVDDELWTGGVTTQRLEELLAAKLAHNR